MIQDLEITKVFIQFFNWLFNCLCFYSIRFFIAGLKDNSEGASCVVWFACIQPLFDLLFTNIIEDEKYAKFEIYKVIIKTIYVEPLPSSLKYKAIRRELDFSK
jgi:hypothetical protein